MQEHEIAKVTAIDPAGCGCMECLTGEYIPYDHYDIDEVLEAALDGIITPKSNVGSSIILYRSGGRVVSETAPWLYESSDRMLIEVDAYSADEDFPKDAINVSLIEDVDDLEEREALIRRVLEGAPTVNPSDRPFLLWSGMGSYSITDLPGLDEDTLTILWD